VISIVQAYGTTDTGRKRRRNEDAFVCEPPLFAVADGMGGAQAGEVASGLAAAALRESGANGGGEQRVVQLIQEANRRVHNRAITDATASGMGTTITAALVEPSGRVAFGHVGDSRAYLLRDGRLDQLTDDHSLVAELVRRGELSPQEAEVHPQRSVITRALGTDPDVDVDTFSIDGRPGDVFLICSDGLSSYVDGAEIEQLIARNRFDLESAAKSLVHAANRGGGDDNITAVLFALAGAGEPDERTREYATKPDAPPEPDDEDTLHPEDRVTLPPEAPEADTSRYPAVDDTIIATVPEALAGPAPEPATPAPAPEPQPQPQTQPQPAGAEAPAEAGLGQRVLASAVIAVLVILIVVLTWWGLAR
jgi:PPM family protein phosphatase